MKPQETAVLLFAFVVTGLFVAIITTKPASAVNPEAASSPAACSSGNALTQVAESAAGVLSLVCSAFVSSIAKSPATLTGAITFLNSTSIGIKNAGQNLIWKVLNVGRGNLTAFPAACSAGTFVTQIATALTCVSSDLVQGARTISSYSKTLLNSTSIGWDFRTGTNTILAKLISQSCPANQFVKTVADSIVCDVVVNSANALTGALTWAATSPLTVVSAGSTITYACPTCVSSNSFTRIDVSINLDTTSPTLVQNTFATFMTGTSGSKAFASNLGAKNMVVVCEGQSATLNVPGAPTDSLGLTYSLITSKAGSAVSAIACWQAKTNAGGADTVTSGTYGLTCSAAALCTLFIQEISGSDLIFLTFAALSTTGGTATPTVFPTMTSISFSKTPLLLGFYQKLTSGTDTAGTNFALMNGETGSLLYLTEKSTSLTSTSTTFPATFGTSSAFEGIGLIVVKASSAFSISLNANTNYVFQVYESVGGAVGNPRIWLHQMDAGVTLQTFCLGSNGGIVTQNTCITTTDNQLPVTGDFLVSDSVILWGTVKVGSTATTLLLEFGCVAGATTNTFPLLAGSYIMVTPVA